MGKGVTHKRPAFERDEAGEQTADRADERARPHGGEHVFVLEGREPGAGHGAAGMGRMGRIGRRGLMICRFPVRGRR